MSRHVKMGVNKVTILSDLQVGNHTGLDEHFQLIYSPDTSLQAWRRMIAEGTVVVKCAILAVMVGSSQLPLDKKFSAAAQFRKLLNVIWEKYAKKVKKVIVLTVLPRPDREVELEEEVKRMNNGICQAVREIKKFNVQAKNTGVIPVHRLFLERYE